MPDQYTPKRKKKPQPLPKPDREPEAEFKATELDVKHGEAVYHHCGNCFECGTPVYLCVTQARHDDLMGNSLAAFVPQAANRAPAAYCQEHFAAWRRANLSGMYPPDPGWRYEKNA